MKFDEIEKQIIQGIINGYSNIDIAVMLDYSESTIKKRLTKIYNRYGIKGRLDLIKKVMHMLK